MPASRFTARATVVWWWRRDARREAEEGADPAAPHDQDGAVGADAEQLAPGPGAGGGRGRGGRRRAPPEEGAEDARGRHVPGVGGGGDTVLRQSHQLHGQVHAGR